MPKETLASRYRADRAGKGDRDRYVTHSFDMLSSYTHVHADPISSCISPAFYFRGDLNQLLPWLRCQPLWGRGSVSTWAQLIWHHGARLASNLPCGRGLDVFSVSVTSYCFITSIEDHKHCLKDLPDKNLCYLPRSCLKFYFQAQLKNQAETELSVLSAPNKSWRSNATLLC